MSIREDMRIKEKQYAEERKKLSEDNEKILEKRKEFQKAFNGAIKERKNHIISKYSGKHFSKTNRPDKIDFEEINSGELMVETAGYIPISEQVRRFERAGENLETEMSQIYDFGTKDIDKNGFSDRLQEQYSDKIEAFQNVEALQLKALSDLIAKKNTPVENQEEPEEPEKTPQEEMELPPQGE